MADRRRGHPVSDTLTSQPTFQTLPGPSEARTVPSAFVIITGISGSGKSLALRVFEDLGFYCVDNLPPALLPQLANVRDGSLRRISCVVDSRAGSQLTGLNDALAELAKAGVQPRILFLDASNPVLVNRFKETRRKHPLMPQAGGILPSISAEREMLSGLKERADKVIDTSDHTPRSLAILLGQLFGEAVAPPLTITVLSFGFKYGLPLDADLVFDVRFLANPHYVRELRWRDGGDPAVAEYVRQDPKTAPFLARLCDLVEFSIPHYIAEGKAYLTIAIGCTGGRHRSVVVAEDLAQFLRREGYEPLVQHRDAKR
ncbi:MAG: RNase adapter RapZ [Armatimonadetes bacterium]|nr:RNase adapter RapZ [Armatimonadota bacterium]